MDRRIIASVLIIILVAAGAYAVLLFTSSDNLTALVGDPSPSRNDVLITEVSPRTEATNEFIELYTSSGFLDMEGWILTTYDDDRVVLPSLTGLTEYLFLLLIGDDGTDELDVSDGLVTIYLGESSSILDTTGDEVGLHDADGLLVSFMRYAGGNGDPILGDWSSNQSDLSVPISGDNSISLSGNADDYQNSWIEAPTTPGNPNVEIFATSGDFGGEELLLFNGIRNPIFTGDFIRPGVPRGENVTVTAGPGVNATMINLIKEHLNFSLNFYREHNFTDPVTAAGNRIRIRIVQSGSPETTAVSSSNGEIVFRIGTDATKEELKVVGEHELLHLFQFKQRTDMNGSSYYPFHDPDFWWDEGMAEFWGVYSMLRNYPNMTMTNWNAMARRLGSLNWFDHFRDTNATGAFDGWGSTWNDYMASFLFIKFINETWGADILLKVFNATRYYGPNDPRNTDPKDEMAKALNMTWPELYGKFLAWLFLDSHTANGVPLYTPHIQLNYTGSAIGDTIGVKGGGGAVIEEIEVSNYTSFRIHLNYTGLAANWSVVVLIFYEDGTNESILVSLDDLTKEGEIAIFPELPKQIAKIWVVKSVTDGAIAGRISMRVIPNVEMTFNNDTIGDTVFVDPNKSIYEVININNTQAFSVFLNWTSGSTSHWNFTILRFWSDGSNDTYQLEIVNGTWPGYVIDPDAGPLSITRLVIIKTNLNETPVAITMRVTPTIESPSNAINPMDDAIPYHMFPVPWDDYGGLVGGYLYIEPGMAYNLTASQPLLGDFIGVVLNEKMQVTTEFLISPTNDVLQLLGYDVGLYYVVIFAGPSAGFSWEELKPYAWP